MNPEPQLAPPGAGLPTAELMAARLLFRFRRWTGNRATFESRFRQERDRIRAAICGLDAKTAARRVLITRLRGLEDSSRYWSVWMTLDHLRIVHGSIVRVIGALTNGVVPPGAASTAAVKPTPDVTADVVVAFEKSCDELLAATAPGVNLATTARYAHPWFGPLNAAGWHAMAGMHLQIHRQQIERILQGLKGS